MRKEKESTVNAKQIKVTQLGFEEGLDNRQPQDNDWQEAWGCGVEAEGGEFRGVCGLV